MPTCLGRLAAVAALAVVCVLLIVWIGYSLPLHSVAPPAASRPAAPAKAPGDVDPAMPPHDADWLDASLGQKYSRDGLTVELTRLGVTAVRGTLAGQPWQSDEPHLVLEFKMSTADPARKFDYDSWADAVLFPPALHDDLGNRYQRVQFPGVELPGRTPRGTAYADKPLTDVLIFQRPVAKALVLYLELPARAVGQPGTIKFRFLPPGRLDS